MLPNIEYCSGTCRWMCSGKNWERSSICLYCNQKAVSKHGTVSCNSPACKKSNQLWHTAFNTTGGVLERVFAPDVSAKSAGICAWCDLPLGSDAEFDHIVPRQVGGGHTVANMQLLHPACNSEKGTRWES